jgi:hypothetical protein
VSLITGLQEKEKDKERKSMEKDSRIASISQLKKDHAKLAEQKQIAKSEIGFLETCIGELQGKVAMAEKMLDEMATASSIVEEIHRKNDDCSHYQGQVGHLMSQNVERAQKHLEMIFLEKKDWESKVVSAQEECDVLKHKTTQLCEEGQQMQEKGMSLKEKISSEKHHLEQVTKQYHKLIKDMASLTEITQQKEQHHHNVFQEREMVEQNVTGAEQDAQEKQEALSVLHEKVNLRRMKHEEEMRVITTAGTEYQKRIATLRQQIQTDEVELQTARTCQREVTSESALALHTLKEETTKLELLQDALHKLEEGNTEQENGLAELQDKASQQEETLEEQSNETKLQTEKIAGEEDSIAKADVQISETKQMLKLAHEHAALQEKIEHLESEHSAHSPKSSSKEKEIKRIKTQETILKRNLKTILLTSESVQECTNLAVCIDMVHKVQKLLSEDEVQMFEEIIQEKKRMEAESSISQKVVEEKDKKQKTSMTHGDSMMKVQAKTTKVSGRKKDKKTKKKRMESGFARTLSRRVIHDKVEDELDVFDFP